MEETLYDKMLDVAKSLNLFFESTEKDQMEIAKNCERVARQAQIDLIEKQKERLEKQKNELLVLLQDANGTLSIHRLTGKIEGVRLAIENNRQEIQELEKQLS